MYGKHWYSSTLHQGEKQKIAVFSALSELSMTSDLYERKFSLTYQKKYLMILTIYFCFNASSLTTVIFNFKLQAHGFTWPQALLGTPPLFAALLQRFCQLLFSPRSCNTRERERASLYFRFTSTCKKAYFSLFLSSIWLCVAFV